MELYGEIDEKATFPQVFAFQEALLCLIAAHLARKKAIIDIEMLIRNNVYKEFTANTWLIADVPKAITASVNNPFSALFHQEGSAADTACEDSDDETYQDAVSNADDEDASEGTASDEDNSALEAEIFQPFLLKFIRYHNTYAHLEISTEQRLFCALIYTFDILKDSHAFSQNSGLTFPNRILMAILQNLNSSIKSDQVALTIIHSIKKIELSENTDVPLEAVQIIELIHCCLSTKYPNKLCQGSERQFSAKDSLIRLLSTLMYSNSTDLHTHILLPMPDAMIKSILSHFSKTADDATDEQKTIITENQNVAIVKLSQIDGDNKVITQYLEILHLCLSKSYLDQFIDAEPCNLQKSILQLIGTIAFESPQALASSTDLPIPESVIKWLVEHFAQDLIQSNDNPERIKNHIERCISNIKNITGPSRVSIQWIEILHACLNDQYMLYIARNTDFTSNLKESGLHLLSTLLSAKDTQAVYSIYDRFARYEQALEEMGNSDNQVFVSFLQTLSILGTDKISKALKLLDFPLRDRFTIGVLATISKKNLETATLIVKKLNTLNTSDDVNAIRIKMITLLCCFISNTYAENLSKLGKIPVSIEEAVSHLTSCCIKTALPEETADPIELQIPNLTHSIQKLTKKIIIATSFIIGVSLAISVSMVCFALYLSYEFSIKQLSIYFAGLLGSALFTEMVCCYFTYKLLKPEINRISVCLTGKAEPTFSSTEKLSNWIKGSRFFPQ
jgi:hypothetical protein